MPTIHAHLLAGHAPGHLRDAFVETVKQATACFAPLTPDPVLERVTGLLCTAPTSCPRVLPHPRPATRVDVRADGPEPFGRSSAPPPPSPTDNGADLARQPDVLDRGGLLGQPRRAREVFEINQANERSEGVAPLAAVLAQ